MRIKFKNIIIIPFGCVKLDGVLRWNKKTLARKKVNDNVCVAREIHQPFTFCFISEESLVITDRTQIDEGCEKFIVEEIK